MRMRAIVARQPSRPFPVDMSIVQRPANHPFPGRAPAARRRRACDWRAGPSLILGAVATRRPNTSICQHVMLRLAVHIPIRA